jgi:hypothetical protein
MIIGKENPLALAFYLSDFFCMIINGISGSTVIGFFTNIAYYLLFKNKLIK